MASPEELLMAAGVQSKQFKPEGSPVVPFSRGETAQPVEPPPPSFSPTPFKWADPASIPARQWVYGKHLIRKFMSVTVAPGGIGKSSLTIAEALAMATGRNLLGPWVEAPLKVWLWNLEDPQEELDRRFAATMMFHRIQPNEVGDRLFVDSGRVQGLCIATQGRHGAQIMAPVVARLESEIKRIGIDVLIVDPFVSSHQVSENDNNAIDMVAKEWARLADRCNIAVQLVHHTRKASGEGETTAESSRGAKSLPDASRDTRTLNRMTKEEAVKAGVDNHRLYFRTYSDKANLAPPAEDSDWYELRNVDLPNGDKVGVVASWEWPNAMDDVKPGDLAKVQKAIQKAGDRNRQSVQSQEWIGHVVGEVLDIQTGRGFRGADLTPEQKNGRAKVSKLLSIWTQSGALSVGAFKDKAKGKTIPILEVGEVAE